MEYRKATDKDIGGIVSLIENEISIDTYPFSLEEFITKFVENYTILVAVDEDKIIGTAGYYEKDNKTFLHFICVDYDQQNKGIGSLLVDLIPNDKEISVVSDFKYDAKLFYVKCGFTEIDSSDHYHFVKYP